MLSVSRRRFLVFSGVAGAAALAGGATQVPWYDEAVVKMVDTRYLDPRALR